MPKLLTRPISVWISMLVVLFFALPVFSQINVTVTLNTATNRDTLSENHLVQIRGEATGTTTPNITWDETSEIFMDNIGGDYWQITFQVNTGDTVKYKFWTGFDLDNPTFFWDGWEGPLIPVEPISGGNRVFIAGANDTTLNLQFYNGNETELDQYWRPYESKADSFAVYFRVNMAGVIEDQSFDPESDEPVVVRGGPPIVPEGADWDVDVLLSPEAESSFYSGVVYFADTSITAGMTQEFKFVYRNGSVWESINNRFFNYSSAKDTTIHWAYFDNKAPTGISLVEATLVWRLKTAALEKLGFFDRGIDRGVVIDGAKAWDVDNAIQLVYSPIVQEWQAEEPFIRQPGTSFEYKAVVQFDSSRIDPSSENYIPGLDTTDLNYWEEPIVTGSGNRTYTYTSNPNQNLPGDLGFDYQFFNGLPAEGVIDNNIRITFNINMEPATSETTNPSNPLFVPGDSVWVVFYGCLIPLTQGQGIYDSDPILLQDLDGDNIYSGSIDLTGPTVFDAGYRIRYREPGGTYIDNGGGFALGRSYYQFIHPTAVHGDGSIEWPAEYNFPTLDWMDSDLTVEEAPDLWTPTAIDPEEGLGIRTFELYHNFPNPFNPVTTIVYQVPHFTHVNIQVYNIAGQLINTLVDEEKHAGKYSVKWNGQDKKGRSVASGIYFVKMKAGDFQKVHKMTLLK